MVFLIPIRIAGRLPGPVANPSIHITTFRGQSEEGKYAMPSVGGATGCMKFSARGYQVPSELSEPFRTPG